MARSIPIGVQNGGDMAGTYKYEFRTKDDPRFTDRRMQNLLRKIEDSISKYNGKQLV